MSNGNATTIQKKKKKKILNFLLQIIIPNTIINQTVTYHLVIIMSFYIYIYITSSLWINDGNEELIRCLWSPMTISHPNTIPLMSHKSIENIYMLRFDTENIYGSESQYKSPHLKCHNSIEILNNNTLRDHHHETTGKQ